MSQMFGKATVKVDGNPLYVDDSSVLDTGGNQRHTVKGTEVYGYAEEAMEASVEVNVFIDANTDIDALNAIKDATVDFKTDTGQHYVLAHAWLAEPVKATAATNGGKTPLKFVGKKAEKV